MITDLQRNILAYELSTPEMPDQWCERVNDATKIANKVNSVLGRMRQKWTPILENRSLTIPEDDYDFANLVFSQPDYKNKAQRVAKTPEQLLEENKEKKIQELEVAYNNAQLIKVINGHTFYVPLKGEFYNTHITQKLTVAQSRGYATLVAQDATGVNITIEDVPYAFWKKFIEVADPISISNFNLKNNYLAQIKAATQEQLNAITISFPVIKEILMDLPDVNDPLQIAKNKKIIEIKAYLQRQLELPTPQPQNASLYTGNLANRIFNVNCREHIPRFSSRVMLLEKQVSPENPNPTMEWTDANNQVVNLTISDYMSLLSHLEARDRNEFEQCRLRKKAVQALATIEEVEAFDITQIIV